MNITSPSSSVRTITRFLFIAFAALFLAASASAQTAAVGTCRPTLIHFDNLDDAVHGIPVGGTILVCPGTYAEQVNITYSLTLRGITDGNNGLPLIVPPVGGLRQNATGLNLPASFNRNAALGAQIFVNGGATANISNIALDATGSLLTDCSLNPVGILYQDASGVVSHVSVKNEISPCQFGNGTPNPQGNGVTAQSDGVFPAAVTVENSSFDNIGLNTLEANGPRAGGVTFIAKGNTIVGPGNTQGNGVYTSFVDATTNNNSISNALHNGEATAFFGIIGECDNTFTASNNRVSNASVGTDIVNSTAFCATAPGGYSITGNAVFNSQLNGIEACGASNAIQGNTINDSGQGGVVLDDLIFSSACGTQAVTVISNTINRACAAVLQGPANGANAIGPNAIFNSKFLLEIGTSCN